MARILIIDDDPDILYMVEGALEDAGHAVTATTDPTRATALAAEQAVDAVVLDINMPGQSGYATLDALRGDSRTGGLPVLFLSALSSSGHRIRGLRQGADDYLGKPFESEELVLRIERLVAQRHREAGGSPASEVEQALCTGKIDGKLYLGRYQALEVIGEGAIGVVLRGWDPRLKRPVALKTLRVRQLAAEERRRLVGDLLHEATSLARLSHPNVVAVYDVEATVDLAFLVIEYVDGLSLSDLVADRGKLPSAGVAALGVAVARGLQAAHAKHVIHRDVKPGNILLGHDHTIKVADFGLAGLANALIEKTGKLWGTPGFIPPEALACEAVDERSDLFSLGAVLYLCLVGSPPFGSGHVGEKLLNTMHREPTPPGNLAAGVPAELDRLVSQLLSKDPGARPANAAEVQERLLKIAGGEPRWRLPEDVRRRGGEPPGERSSVTRIDAGSWTRPSMTGV